jgi:hypothetical protein
MEEVIDSIHQVHQLTIQNQIFTGVSRPPIISSRWFLMQDRKASCRSIFSDATVFADGMHGAILLDDRCPDLGLTLGVTLPNADHSVTEFDKNLWSVGSAGTSGAKFTGTFVGRLMRDPTTTNPL